MPLLVQNINHAFQIFNGFHFDNADQRFLCTVDIKSRCHSREQQPGSFGLLPGPVFDPVTRTLKRLAERADRHCLYFQWHLLLANKRGGGKSPWAARWALDVI